MKKNSSWAIVLAVFAAAWLLLFGFSSPALFAQQLDGAPWRQYRPDIGYTWRGRVIVVKFPQQKDRLARIPQWRKFSAVQLKLLGRSVNDDVLRKVAQLENLESLMIEGEGVTDEGANHLKRLPRLRELQLYRARLTRQGMMHLTAHKHLVDLSLGACTMEDGLAALTGLPSLRHLSLIAVSGLNKADLQSIGKINRLETLSIDRFPLGDEAISHLAGLSRLQNLFLRDAVITDHAAAHLRSLGRLEGLWISDSSRLSNKGVAELKSAPALRSINGVSIAHIADELPSPRLKRTLSMLDRPTQMQFDETPLEDVFEYLSALHDIHFDIDPAVLDRMPGVMLSFHDKRFSLRSALDLLLDEHDLAWKPEPDRILITFGDRIRGRLITRRYDLAHWVENDPTAVAQFASLIRQFVDPSQWRASGSGMSPQLRVDETGLIISQYARIHRQIETFLEDCGFRGAGHRPQGMDQRRIASLDRRMRLNLEDVPFSQLVDFLRSVLDIPVNVEQARMKKHELPLEPRLTAKTKNLPMWEALDRVLGPHKLTWTVRHGSLVITPKAFEPNLLQTRVYHIGELLLDADTDAEGVTDHIRRQQGLDRLPGRKAAVCINRVVVRATFGEHWAIEKTFAKLRGDLSKR